MHVVMIGTGYVGLVSGACDIAVSNTYYFARAQAETVEGLSEGVAGIGWVMPNQETTRSPASTRTLARSRA